MGSKSVAVLQQLRQFLPNRHPSWKWLLGLILSAGIFGYLSIKAYHGVQLIAETGLNFGPGYLLLAVLCQVLGVSLAVAVWDNILRRLGVHSGYSFNLKAFGISAVARKLPGTIWYAISRLALYEQRQYPRWSVILALAIELVSLSLAGLTAFCLGLSTGFVNIPVIANTGLWLVIGIGVLIGLASLQPWMIRWFLERRNSPLANDDELSIRFGHTFLWLGGETAVVALATGVLFFLVKSIDAAAPVTFLPVFGAFGLAIALGPVAVWLPADVGLKDGFVYLALSPVLTGPLAAVVILIWRLMVTLMDVLFGLSCGASLGYSVLRRRERPREMRRPDTDFENILSSEYNEGND